MHWLLYALVLVTAFSRWFYASARGWSLTFFGLFPLPALVVHGSSAGRAFSEIHESIVWVLLGVIVIHVLAALVHAFVYRDQVMQRVLFRATRRTSRRHKLSLRQLRRSTALFRSSSTLDRET